MKINFFREDDLNYSAEELGLEAEEFEEGDWVHVRDYGREYGEYSEEFVILDIISEDESIVALLGLIV